MLVETEPDRECKYCDAPIEENPGWILYKWVHKDTGAYSCWTSTPNVRAEPKEVT